jgi:hypothetical protein
LGRGKRSQCGGLRRDGDGSRGSACQPLHPKVRAQRAPKSEPPRMNGPTCSRRLSRRAFRAPDGDDWECAASADDRIRFSKTREDMISHSRGTGARGLHDHCPSKMEGAGKVGCPLHPQPVCNGSKHTVVTTGTPGHPTFPAQWFYGLCRALPGDEFVLSPSSANMDCLSPVGPTHLRRLDTSNGCQDHTVLPYALAPFVCAHC